MLYEQYTIGGELMHSAKGVEWKNKKYIDKIKTKTGKWRYIYQNTKNYNKNLRNRNRHQRWLDEDKNIQERNDTYRKMYLKELEYEKDPKKAKGDLNVVNFLEAPDETSKKNSEFRTEFRNAHARERDSYQYKIDNSVQGMVNNLIDKIIKKKKKKK